MSVESEGDKKPASEKPAAIEEFDVFGAEDETGYFEDRKGSAVFQEGASNEQGEVSKTSTDDKEGRERNQRGADSKNEAGDRSEFKLDPRKVFVGQIPRSYSETDVRDLFQDYEIENVNLIFDGVTKLPRGCAFILFRNEEEAMRAIENMHKSTTLSGMLSPIQVKRARPNVQHKLYIGNLDAQTTEVELRQVFERFGTVDEISVIKSSEGVCRGYAFVQFLNPSDAKRAIDTLHGTVLFEGVEARCIVKYADSHKQRMTKRFLQGKMPAERDYHGPSSSFRGPQQPQPMFFLPSFPGAQPIPNPAAFMMPPMSLPHGAPNFSPISGGGVPPQFQKPSAQPAHYTSVSPQEAMQMMQQGGSHYHSVHMEPSYDPQSPSGYQTNYQMQQAKATMTLPLSYFTSGERHPPSLQGFPLSSNNHGSAPPPQSYRPSNSPMDVPSLNGDMMSSHHAREPGSLPPQRSSFRTASTLYVSNLPLPFCDADLLNLFGYYMPKSAVMHVDKLTGYPSNFGFVELPNPSMAQAAIRQLDGAVIANKRIKVSQKRDKRPY